MLLPRAAALLAGYALVAIAQVAAEAVDADGLAALAQVLLMPVLAAALLAQTPVPRGRLVTLTLVALGFSWLGDTAPRLLDGNAAFLALVGFFLVAQACYIAAFRRYAADGILRRRRGWLLVYAAAVLALVLTCLPDAGVMGLPVVGYGACLGTMAVLSTGVDRLAWAGGALFLVSDGLIALDAFVAGYDLPQHDAAVMATYVVAQALLVLGVIRRAGRADPTRSRPSSGGGSTAAPAGRRTTPPPAAHPR